MTETKSCHESALPAKRKSDLTSQDHDPLPHKSPKLQTQDETIQPSQEDHALHPSGNNDSSVSEPRPENPDPEIDSGEGEEDEDGDYEDDDNEEEGEENGSTPVDRKGKGVLIEEENDSDDEDDDENDDDSSDGGNESEGESDLSDDPLAEVDLDNILPSRTRRRVVRPGLHIAKEVGNKDEAVDSDGSDS